MGSLQESVTHKRDESRMRRLHVWKRAEGRDLHFFEEALLVAVVVSVAESRVSSQQMIKLMAVIEWMAFRVQKMCSFPIPCCFGVGIERRVYVPGFLSRRVLMGRPSGEAVSVAASYQLVVGKVLYLPELQGALEVRRVAIVQPEQASKSVMQFDRLCLVALVVLVVDVHCSRYLEIQLGADFAVVSLVLEMTTHCSFALPVVEGRYCSCLSANPLQPFPSPSG